MKYLVLLLPIFLYACGSGDQKPVDLAAKKTSPHYHLTPVEQAAMASSLKMPGQLAAYEEVSIYPKVNGYVKSVFVDIGSRVKKGQQLMLLEAPELMQASLEARERFTRAKADFLLDKEHYQRLMEASATAGAISPLDLSTVKTKMEADSALSNAEKSAWEMQETMLAYLKVTTPFDGVITQRNVHPGALISATDKTRPMLELKSIDRLRLQVDIPEQLAVNLRLRDTVSFYTSALPGKKMTGFISRKSSDVNTSLRSERMEMDVDNKNEILAPGMYADVVIYSKGDMNSLSVPRTAVITTTERKYVVTVVGGKAKKIDVTTGSEAGGKMVVFGALNANELVVVNPSEDIAEGDKMYEETSISQKR